MLSRELGEDYIYEMVNIWQNDRIKPAKNCVNDLTDKKIGKLNVLYLSNKKSSDGKHMWKSICDCQFGKNIEDVKFHYATGSNLKSGRTTSCGCVHDECTRQKGLKNKKFNKYDLESENYGIGYTRKGYEFYFDKEDYNLIKDYCWHKHTDGYLRTCYEITLENKHKYIMMHQLIGRYYGMNDEVDHINGKPNDNRKENFRNVFHINNSKNTKKYMNNTSGHKGICWNKNLNKYQAYINSDNNRIHLGFYEKYDEAVNVREKAEEKYFGQYNREYQFL